MIADAREREYRFVLSSPEEWWSEDDIRLILTIGKLVPSNSYRDTWSLSKTPGGYRYYAWKRAWRRARAAVVRKRYLRAESLADLLRQVEEMTE